MTLDEMAAIYRTASQHCDRKVIHLTHTAAERAAERIRRKANVDDALRLDAYKCPRCGWWHAGRRKEP